jgi:hypothetical protein
VGRLWYNIYSGKGNTTQYFLKGWYFKMAQTVKYIIFNSDDVSMEIVSIQDENEIAELAYNEFELQGKVDYEAYWFEFGEGESGTDEFISESEVLAILENGINIEEEFYARGYDGELIESSCGEIDINFYISIDEESEGE